MRYVWSRLLLAYKGYFVYSDIFNLHMSKNRYSLDVDPFLLICCILIVFIQWEAVYEEMITEAISCEVTTIM